ncbi:MAG: ATP-binding protein [Sphingomicrobium sp.]
MALLIALCVLVAQAINVSIVLENRRASGIDAAIAPAAQRLATIALADRDDPVAPVPAPRAMTKIPTANVASAHHRPQVSIVAPIAADAERLTPAETRAKEIFHDNQLRPRAIRAVRSGRGIRAPGVIHLAAQLDDGRWISVRVPGPPPMGPILLELLLQAVVVYLIIVVPALILLRHSGSTLRRLTHAAAGFPADVRPTALPPAGPRDIRALIDSFNAMRQRIAAMIEEKNVMLGAIGHDLRTPLTAMRIEAEGLEQPETRTAIIEAIEGMHRQLENILVLARFDRAPGSTSPVDLGALAAATVESYQAAGQPVRLALDGAPQLLGDRAALGRALSNLIDNALRYAGGADVHVGVAGGMAVVSIDDNGPGIASDRLEEAVAPFGRLDPSRNPEHGGHGLGLAIVDSIVRLHQGRLELLPRQPTGLSARIVLPLA